MKGRVWSGIAALTLVGGILAGCGSQPASTTGGAAASNNTGANGTVKLLETGSSLLYPLFNIWQPAYTKDHTNVQIDTASTGSGTGIAEALKGQVQIGASDAYLSDGQMQQNPNMLNIPLAISAQQINYNLPGLNDKHLNLSGPVLADIYSGKITKWNDPKIAELNPGVVLPSNTIVPIHRADGSGDTFLFTQFLNKTTPTWTQFGTSINWPAVPGSTSATGNGGIVQALQQTPYAIGYVGVSYLDQTNKAGLGYAALQNKDGNFVLPTAETIQAAAAAVVSSTPKDMRVSLINAPGKNAYPIINYEYAIVNAKQPDAATAQALKDFLTWAISANGGNQATFLDQVHFVPLPSAIAQMSADLIAKIGG